MLTASGPPASRLLGQPSCSPLRRATAKPGSSIALRGRKAALRVASRYAGSGAPPPQQYRPPLAGALPQQPSQQQYRAPPSPTQQPPMQQPTQAPQQQQYRPPMQQQPRQQQRAPLPSTRRVGVSPRLQQQQQQQPPAQQQRAGSLQQLATSAAAVLPAQSRADTSTEAVQARAGQQPPAEVNLSRSQLMDKEVITRQAGAGQSRWRLGQASQGATRAAHAAGAWLHAGQESHLQCCTSQPCAVMLSCPLRQPPMLRCAGPAPTGWATSTSCLWTQARSLSCLSTSARPPAACPASAKVQQVRGGVGWAACVWCACVCARAVCVCVSVWWW